MNGVEEILAQSGGGIGDAVVATAAHVATDSQEVDGCIAVISDESQDCSDAVLESIDSCVSCVDGADIQRHFEETIGQYELVELAPFTPTRHVFSEAEAFQIRQQILDVEERAERGHNISMKGLDVFNFCGANNAVNSLEVPGRTPSPRNDDSEDTSSSPDGTMESVGYSPAKGDKDVSALMHCSVCSAEGLSNSAGHTLFTEIPCCSDSANVEKKQVCMSCLLLLTYATPDGSSRVGRCPCCCELLKLAAGPSELVVLSTKGVCVSCRQSERLLVEQDGICEFCFFGEQVPLLYECQECHTRQRMQYPLYRYQVTPDVFSTETRTCRGRCGQLTNWRVLPDQVSFIPVGDEPKSWGLDGLKVARARVQAARSVLVQHQSRNGCFIL